MFWNCSMVMVCKVSQYIKLKKNYHTNKILDEKNVQVKIHSLKILGRYPKIFG